MVEKHLFDKLVIAYTKGQAGKKALLNILNVQVKYYKKNGILVLGYLKTVGILHKFLAGETDRESEGSSSINPNPEVV